MLSFFSSCFSLHDNLLPYRPFPHSVTFLASAPSLVFMLLFRPLPRLVAVTTTLPLLPTAATALRIASTCAAPAAAPPPSPSSSVVPAPVAVPFLPARPFSQTAACAMSAPAPAPAEPPVSEVASTCPAPPTVDTTTTAPATEAAGEAKKEEEKEEPALPPLTPAEYRVYNRMADGMEYYHAHFRQTWNTLWSAATSGGPAPKRPAARALVAEGLQFVRHLTVHHDIEETHIFPVLARKMPEFAPGKGRGASELLRQHREIHKGMDGLEAYLTRCRLGDAELDLAELRAVMESWGPVLWTHLDQEVKTLAAENMRKYWTQEEMRRLPM